MQDTIPEEERLASKQAVGAVLGGEKTSGQRTFIRRDGTRFIGEIHSGPIYDGQKIVGVRGVLRDITKRREAEKALRESEHRFRTLFDMSPQPIAVTEVDTGRVLDVNKAFCEITGYAKEEVLGRTTTDVGFYLEEDRRKFLSELQRSGEVLGLEMNFKTKEGLTVTELMFSRLVEIGGQTVILTVFFDITERKRLEAQLLHAQKMEAVGALAGGIAHDFNNLLVGVLGNADLALRDLPPRSPLRRNLEEIVDSARRAADLTNQMLAYSGKGRVVVEDVDLNGLIEGMTGLLESSISKKAVLGLDFSDGLPAIRADATQISQIVMNLVTNGSEAMGDRSGQIRVTTDVIGCDRVLLNEIQLHGELPEGPYVVLKVSDTGCGMDPETRAKMFDPFFTTKFMGRGLGLAGVHGIVRRHQGGIRVESQPGRGTTFQVFFPALDRPADAKGEATAAETAWQGSGTILLADDEEIVRTVGKRMLEQMGFTVLLASNGAEAVDLFREHQDEIACILLDFKMPDLDGEETFRELHRIRKDAVVVLSSGYSEEEFSERFAGKGLAGFIQKPYETEALKKKLHEILGT
jgi:PAS domain S-box-containing protein